jgi:hypothetical protein
MVRLKIPTAYFSNNNGCCDSATQITEGKHFWAQRWKQVSEEFNKEKM